MADQMQLYDTSEKQSSNNTGKAKRKWENGFQRWSNRHSADGGSSFGCCEKTGYEEVWEGERNGWDY